MRRPHHLSGAVQNQVPSTALTPTPATRTIVPFARKSMGDFLSLLISSARRDPPSNFLKYRNCLQETRREAVMAPERPSRSNYASHFPHFCAGRGRDHRPGGVHPVRRQIADARAGKDLLCSPPVPFVKMDCLQSFAPGALDDELATKNGTDVDNGQNAARKVAAPPPRIPRGTQGVHSLPLRRMSSRSW